MLFNPFQAAPVKPNCFVVVPAGLHFSSEITVPLVNLVFDFYVGAAGRDRALICFSCTRDYDLGRCQFQLCFVKNSETSFRPSMSGISAAAEIAGHQG